MNRKVFEPLRLWLGAVVLAWAVWGRPPGDAFAQEENIRIRDHLYAARRRRADEGWTVGSFGAMYHTDDRGKKREKQDSGVSEALYGVVFIDGKEGWVSGKTGVVLHTIGGGAKWEKQTTGV